MSSDALHRLQELSPRLEALSGRATHLMALRGQLVKDLDQRQTEVAALTSDIEKLVKVEELFKTLFDLLITKQVRVVEEMVTQGLQSVFPDQNLHFESSIQPKYNKVSVDFMIRRGDKDDPLSILDKPTEGFGGGPTILASLILRVVTLVRLKRHPILFLDEPLWAVSDEYVNNTGRFLRSLADNMGIQILMITHKTAYLEHATRSYRGQEEALPDSRTRLQIRNLT